VISLSCLDTKNQTHDLEWLYHEKDEQPLLLKTIQYYLLEAALKPTRRLFISPDQQKHAAIEVEGKVHSYDNFSETENLFENFEKRERAVRFASSISLVLFPKYIIVNKNMFPVQFSGDKKRYFVFPAATSDYFNYNNPSKKVSFKLQGYKDSEDIDLDMLGNTGICELENDKGI